MTFFTPSYKIAEGFGEGAQIPVVIIVPPANSYGFTLSCPRFVRYS